MARIRSIKPEFPQSESMGNVSRDARLLFILLWPICDDHGRTRAASRMLASTLFPYDEDAKDLIDGWLDELEQERCIRRYSVNGSAYLEICKWLDHQKIDKPSKPQFPEPIEDSENPREPSRTLPVGEEGKGGEGNGREKKGATATRLPADWFPSESDVAYCKTERPELDPAKVAENFRDYWHAEGGPKARKVDWSLTWKTWVRHERGPVQTRASPNYHDERKQTITALTTTGGTHEPASNERDITGQAERIA